ncbi:ABC transporter substrate-binding protein [Rhodoplanes azumiensis]|uniref:ABC transporter substrate-binding protein n=1 Tax=Rhodoplanes azumiensis TaxID=1897628 RepID=A0ABW5APG0_9BRAD
MLQVTMAGGFYDRTRALIDGSVRPEGLSLTYVELPIEEVFWRLLRYGEFDIAECSLAYHMIAKARGIGHDYVAIPLFPSRCFRHGFVFVNRNSGIRAPEDLAGKIMGVPEYAMTAALWLRGLFEHDYGVPPGAMRWRVGGIEEPNRADRMEITVDADVEILPIPPGKSLVGMLAAGDIDAMMGPRVPSIFRQGHPDIVRLFPNYPADERAWYARTKVVPIMHTVVIRRALYDREPWIAMSLFKAFRESSRRCLDRMRDVNALPYSLPWYLPALEETIAVFGEDFWPEGLEANWPSVAMLMGFAKEQGLIDRLFTPEELFAPSTLTEFKI